MNGWVHRTDRQQTSRLLLRDLQKPGKQEHSAGTSVAGFVKDQACGGRQTEWEVSGVAPITSPCFCLLRDPFLDPNLSIPGSHHQVLGLMPRHLGKPVGLVTICHSRVQTLFFHRQAPN